MEYQTGLPQEAPWSLPSDPKVESKRMQEIENKARSNSPGIRQDFLKRRPGPSPPTLR
jgi:hypothetical protein